MDYTQHEPLPAWTDLNSGLTSASAARLADVLGNPRSDYSENCQEPDNPNFIRQLWEGPIGPFTVKGHHLFLRALRAGFDELAGTDPDLIPLIATAGCICCRWVRGYPGVLSNHSFGCAIDLKVGGELVPLGAGWCTQGHLKIYEVMHKQGLYWGGGYHQRKDAMHFEASNELIDQWVKNDFE